MRLLLACASVFGVTLFYWQNKGPVSLKFAYWATWDYPLALVLVVTFAVGFLLAGLYFLIDVFRLRSRLRRSERKCELVEKEADALRNQPLYDEVPSPLASSSGSLEPILMHEGQPEVSLDIVEPRKTR